MTDFCMQSYQIYHTVTLFSLSSVWFYFGVFYAYMKVMVRLAASCPQLSFPHSVAILLCHLLLQGACHKGWELQPIHIKFSS